MAKVLIETSARHIHLSLEDLKTLFGKDYFDVIQGQEEGLAIKPSPEGVFRVLDKLSLSVEDILYVGDTSTDMQTGKSAGAYTVGVLWGFRDRDVIENEGAEYIVETVNDLEKLLICLKNG